MGLGLGFRVQGLFWGLGFRVCGLRFFFFMGSFPTAVQQEFLYQDEPLVGASGLRFRV